MENTLSRVGVALVEEQSAVWNGSAATSKIKLMLMWLSVCLPLLWGAIQALKDIGSLPL